MSETNEQPAEQPSLLRCGLTREQLTAFRQRFVEIAAQYAGKGDTTSFRRWRKAKDSIREIDAMLATIEKDQPQ